MSLAARRERIKADLAAIAGAVTYRQLADQLKLAIADAQTEGLAEVSVQSATGTTVTYPSINVALLALKELEQMAGEEAGGIFAVGVRLK
jgi:hypothetical protein